MTPDEWVEVETAAKQSGVKPEEFRKFFEQDNTWLNLLMVRQMSREIRRQRVALSELATRMEEHE